MLYRQRLVFLVIKRDAIFRHLNDAQVLSLCTFHKLQSTLGACYGYAPSIPGYPIQDAGFGLFRTVQLEIPKAKFGFIVDSRFRQYVVTLTSLVEFGEPDLK